MKLNQDIVKSNKTNKKIDRDNRSDSNQNVESFYLDKSRINLV